MRTTKHSARCGSMSSTPALAIENGQQHIDNSARDFDQGDGGTTGITGIDSALVNA